MVNLTYKNFIVNFSIGDWGRLTDFRVSLRNDREDVLFINNDVFALFELISFLEAYLAGQIQEADHGMYAEYKVKKKNKIAYLYVSDRFGAEVFISKVDVRIFLKLLRYIERNLQKNESLEMNYPKGFKK